MKAKTGIFGLTGLLLAQGIVKPAFAITARLTWNASSDPNLVGYNVYFGPTNAVPQTISAGIATSLSVSNLVAGKTYTFYTTALSASGLESDPSQQVTFKYDCGNMNLEDTGSSGMKVHFNSAAGSTYAVESKDNFPGGTWRVLASSLPGNGSPMEVLDNSTAGISNRIYRVRTTNSNITVEWAGYQRVALAGNSDTLLSLPFLRPPSAYGTVQSSSAATVQFSGSPAWAVNRWLYSSGTQSNTYFLLIRSGAREGDYFTITGNTANAVTVDLQGGNLAGLSAGDTLAIVPFWTLGTIFPGGKGVNASPAPGSRSTELLIPDIGGSGVNLATARTYYYWSGSWRQVGSGQAVKNDDVILPDMYVWVRQNVSTSTELLSFGSVVPNAWRLSINRQTDTKQDNLVALPRPTPISLNASGLIASGVFQTSPTVANRTDQLLVFDTTLVGKNRSVAATYYYWNGAWRKVGGGTADFGSDLVFAPSSGVIIRANAGSVGTSGTGTWSNTPNY